MQILTENICCCSKMIFFMFSSLYILADRLMMQKITAARLGTNVLYHINVVVWNSYSCMGARNVCNEHISPAIHNLLIVCKAEFLKDSSLRPRPSSVHYFHCCFTVVTAPVNIRKTLQHP